MHPSHITLARQLESIVYQIENGKGAMPAWEGRLGELWVAGCLEGGGSWLLLDAAAVKAC